MLRIGGTPRQELVERWTEAEIQHVYDLLGLTDDEVRKRFQTIGQSYSTPQKRRFHLSLSGGADTSETQEIGR